MDKKEQIRQALRKFTDPGTCTILGLVQSVDVAEKTIVLKDDQTGVEIFDVRLRPVVDSTSFITVYPKVNTWCLAVRIEDDSEWMVLSVAEADKYEIKIGTQVLTMDGNKYDIKKGSESLGGILDDLITQILAMVFTTPVGPTLALVNATAITAIKTRLSNILQ